MKSLRTLSGRQERRPEGAFPSGHAARRRAGGQEARPPSRRISASTPAGRPGGSRLGKGLR